MKEPTTSKKYEDFKFITEAFVEANNSRICQENFKKVGAIIVKNGRIVGRGCRTTTIIQENPYKDVTYHAEHNAIMEAGDAAKGATLYSTLEPCAVRLLLPNSFEPPQPCCQLIHEAGIKRVVFPKRDEKFGGAKYLLEKGIEVNVCEFDLEEFAKLINKPVWRNDVAELEDKKTFLKAD